MTNPKFKSVLTTILMAILLSCFLSSCNKRIDAGHEGILIKQYGSDKGVSDVAIVTGRVWYNPWTEGVEQMPTFVQTVDYNPFVIDAKGGGTFTVDPTISIRVNVGKSDDIYTKYRIDLEDIVNTSVLNYVKDAYRIAFNKYDMDWIINNREKLESEIEVYLTKTLEVEGFHLEKLTSGWKYPDAITNAINEKNKAFQEGLRVETQLKVEKAQAEIDLLKARTQAEANRLREQTLSDLLIQQQFIEKWDGHTPLYGGSPVLFKSVK